MTPIQVTKREFIKITLTGVGMFGLGLKGNALNEQPNVESKATSSNMVPEKDIAKTPIPPKIDERVPKSVIENYEKNREKVLALKPGEKLEKGIIAPFLRGQDGRIYYHALRNLIRPATSNTYTGLSDYLVYTKRKDISGTLVYSACPQLVGSTNMILNSAIVVDFFAQLHSMDGQPSILQGNGVFVVPYLEGKLELVLGSDECFHVAKKFGDSIGWEEISGTVGVGLNKEVSALGVQQFLDENGFLKGERIKGSSWKPFGKYNKWRNVFVFDPLSKEAGELEGNWETILYLKPTETWEGTSFKWIMGNNARVFCKEKSIDSLLWKCVHDGEWYIEQEKIFVWLAQYKAPSGSKYLVDSSLNMYDITSGKKLVLPERIKKGR
jgi:hypothetical protein